MVKDEVVGTFVVDNNRSVGENKVVGTSVAGNEVVVTSVVGNEVL